MSGKQAKTLSNPAIAAVKAYLRTTRYAQRDTAIFLLSIKAGLRACEIAGLEWSMVLNADGQIGTVLELSDDIAKKGGGRKIPINSELRKALCRLASRGGTIGYVAKSERGGGMAANSIVNWFALIYRRLDLMGCSSHSGRRTFITTAARRLHLAGASLRDVQQLAGHKSIEVTQRYIDGHSVAQRKLVELV